MKRKRSDQEDENPRPNKKLKADSEVVRSHTLPSQNQVNQYQNSTMDSSTRRLTFGRPSISLVELIHGSSSDSDEDGNSEQFTPTPRIPNFQSFDDGHQHKPSTDGNEYSRTVIPSNKKIPPPPPPTLPPRSHSSKISENTDFQSRSHGKYRREEISVYIDTGVFKEQPEKCQLTIATLISERFDVYFINDEHGIQNSIRFKQKFPVNYTRSKYFKRNHLPLVPHEANPLFLNRPINDFLFICIPAHHFVSHLLPHDNKSQRSKFDKFEEYLDSVEKRENMFTKSRTTIIYLIIDSLDSCFESLPLHSFDNDINNKISARKELQRVIINIEMNRPRIRFVTTSSPEETIRSITDRAKSISDSFYKGVDNSSNSKKKLSLYSNYKKNIRVKARDIYSATICFYAEIPGVSEKMAKAIIRKYPKIGLLRERYLSRDLDDRNKRLLLKDIIFRKMEGEVVVLVKLCQKEFMSISWRKMEKGR